MRLSPAARIYLPGNTRNVWWSGALWLWFPRTRNGVAATPAVAGAYSGQVEAAEARWHARLSG